MTEYKRKKFKPVNRRKLTSAGLQKSFIGFNVLPYHKRLILACIHNGNFHRSSFFRSFNQLTLTCLARNTSIIDLSMPGPTRSTGTANAFRSGIKYLQNLFYGQSNSELGAYFNYRPNVHHFIDWMSAKQKRVCNSSYGADILAFEEVDDRRFYFKLALQSITLLLSCKHLLPVNSLGLFVAVFTLHEENNYRLWWKVQRIRDFLDGEDIYMKRWTSGSANLVGAMTKRNQAKMRLLNRICQTGQLILRLHEQFELQSETWKWINKSHPIHSRQLGYILN